MAMKVEERRQAAYVLAIGNLDVQNPQQQHCGQQE
jgi:hypothetical protein